MNYLPQRRKRGEPPRLTRSVVYFIRAQLSANEHAVKIGVSDREPVHRLRQMQTGCPLELELLHSIPGTAKLERAIHQAFPGHLLRGEWFRSIPDDDDCPIRNFVDRLIAGDCVFDLLKKRWALMMESEDSWHFRGYCDALKELVEDE